MKKTGYVVGRKRVANTISGYVRIVGSLKAVQCCLSRAWPPRRGVLRMLSRELCQKCNIEHGWCWAISEGNTSWPCPLKWDLIIAGGPPYKGYSIDIKEKPPAGCYYLFEYAIRMTKKS